MKPQRSLADPRLTALLNDLLSEEHLPPLDRWFSAAARRAQWPSGEQKRLWDALRRALTRSPLLVGTEAAESAWAGFRVALRGRAQEWALRTDLPASAPSRAAGGIPAWLAPEFEERVRLSAWSTEEVGTFLALQESSPPVHVRFRSGAEGEACAHRLRAKGAIEASDVEGIDRLTGGPRLEASDDWKRGMVEIQDAASQLSLARLGLRPGMRVWDVCAGRGGKTLLAAAELRGKGALVATDVVETKLRSLKERIKRSGWQNLRLLHWDGEVLPAFGPEFASHSFDRVIVDAPCTASGTWRRDPEGRLRLTPRGLKELVRHQERLLRLGWSALKPGGRLAYVTCSWLPTEDERIVEGFLEETDARVVHQELLGLPAFDANTLFVCILEKPQ